MKACLNDLSSNLSKVETRVFLKQKENRERRRRAMGLAAPVPREVLAGRMSPSLYDVECRLHREIGLPAPTPYAEYQKDLQRLRGKAQRVGFVEFRVVMNAVRTAFRS